MPAKRLNWCVDDGSYNDNDAERFPAQIQQRIEDSCDKQGWLRPGEQYDGSKPYGPGCGVGKGWLDLIIELDDILSIIDSEYQIHQIKEKFGQLRFYAVPTFGSGRHWDPDKKEHVIDDMDEFLHWEAFHAQISRIENRSAYICEVCGEFGEMITEGRWARVRCEKHKDI